MEPKEARAKWAEVLRSGRFTQYNGALSGGGNERCCLGVACDVFKELTGEGEWDQKEDEGYLKFILGEERESAILPEKVAAFYGVDEHPLSEGRGLATLNDSGLSFTQLADLIEKL